MAKVLFKPFILSTCACFTIIVLVKLKAVFEKEIFFPYIKMTKVLLYLLFNWRAPVFIEIVLVKLEAVFGREIFFPLHKNGNSSYHTFYFIGVRLFL